MRNASASTFTFDLLVPWVVLGTVLVVLMMIQRWIHRHLFGVGFLLAKDKYPATFFYYLLLMPGVFLHEFSHWMMAGVFGIKHKRFEFFPHSQQDGSLEMGFLELEAIKNPVHAAIVGIAPLLTGLGMIVWISYGLLNVPALFASLQTGDMNVIGPAFQALVTKPDFPLWTYLVFAIANSMMPSREDRAGWWIVGVGFIGLIIFLIVIGLQFIVVNWLNGGIAQVLYWLSAVFGIVVALDCFAALIILVIELILERVTGHKVEYRTALPAGTQSTVATQKPKLLSVYDLRLPIPPAPGKAVKSARLPAEKPPEREAIGSGQAAAKPAFPAQARPQLPASNSPGTALARPNLTSPTTGPQPAPKAGPTPARTFGTPAKPAPFGTRRNDDIIEADVVEDDEDNP